MSRLSCPEYLLGQYQSGEKLSARIRLHQKHSENKQPFSDWLFAQYAFGPRPKVIELGAGTGAQWTGRKLAEGMTLVLSDISPGMVDTLSKSYAGLPGALCMRADIQSLPFAGESFDAAMAHFMLYHLPDIPKALSEVNRVLKPGGVFYCATNGENGIRAYLEGVRRALWPERPNLPEDFPFSLQNGGAQLAPHFARVRQVVREDALCVTEAENLTAWVASALELVGFSREDLPGLHAHFEQTIQREGAVRIPKEVGMFICTK